MHLVVNMTFHDKIWGKVRALRSFTSQNVLKTVSQCFRYGLEIKIFELGLIVFLICKTRRWMLFLLLFVSFFFLIASLKLIVYLIVFLNLRLLWFGKPEIFPPQKERTSKTMHDALYPFEVRFYVHAYFCQWNPWPQLIYDLLRSWNSVDKLNFHIRESFWWIFASSMEMEQWSERNLILGSSLSCWRSAFLNL